MSYVVLFKVYFWDDFVQRQLERLTSRVGRGLVYVIADETRGPVDGIGHDSVIRTTEAQFLSKGLSSGNKTQSLFWYSADYCLHVLFDQNIPFDHCITVEYDAVINHDLDVLVEKVAQRGIDFVGGRIATKPESWVWTKSCDRIYRLDEIKPYLNIVAVYSCRAVKLLMQRRYSMSRQFEAGDIDQWPISEAFIGTEIARAGQLMADLAEFGDVSHLDWWPPYDERMLTSLEHLDFIHPVLQGEHFYASLFRPEFLDRLFWRDSPLADRLKHLDRCEYMPKLALALTNHRKPPDSRADTLSFPLPLFDEDDPGDNIAFGKHATQSSTSRYSRHNSVHNDARGAVNGLVTGTFGFHTDLEPGPWWMVDLGAVYRLVEIHVFNRLLLRARAAGLMVRLSTNSVDWRTVYEHSKENADAFWGAWGRPLTVMFPDGEIARFVRLELPGTGYLHLDQVKVFGALAVDGGA